MKYIFITQVRGNRNYSTDVDVSGKSQEYNDMARQLNYRKNNDHKFDDENSDIDEVVKSIAI